MKKAVLVFLAIFNFAYAQELNCSVRVISDQIQTSDRRVFSTLETAAFEFMNNTKWTKDEFRAHEKIECSILITISERPNPDKFVASIQIQSRRPVYNSSYSSILLNHRDQDFEFGYIEFQLLQYSETAYLSNLTSVLSFYAYIILGIDYDSFSLQGGQRYFETAQAIMGYAQSSGSRGWASDNTQNRYSLIYELMFVRYQKYRNAIYEYHRKGLDMMYQNPTVARESIFSALENLETIYKENPVSFLLQIFFNAKAEELVSIYSEALPNEKSRAKKILKEINGVNSNVYDKIN